MSDDAKGIGEFLGMPILDCELRVKLQRFFPADMREVTYYEPDSTNEMLKGNTLDQRIIRMSRSVGYFPLYVAQIIEGRLKFVHPICSAGDHEYHVEYAGLGPGGEMWVQIRRIPGFPSWIRRFFGTRVLSIPELFALRDGMALEDIGSGTGGRSTPTAIR